MVSMVRDGAISPSELLEEHLRQIEAENPAVNAFVTVLAGQAREEARALEALIARGEPLGLLHGVPLTVKDSFDVAGLPTRSGSRFRPTTPAAHDATAVARLRAEGAIILGKTNTPDLLASYESDNFITGRSNNPWDLDRTPGGSSGGEAAALATGMTPLGVGGDLGGSLRWPAQCCGICSLKPTLGRIPRGTTIEPADLPIANQLMMVEGPLARRVADLRAAFELMAGPSWRDPWTVPAPLRGPEPAWPVRVAVVTDPAGQGTSSQVQDGVREAAAALADAGYAVEEAEPPSIDAAARAWLDILTSAEMRLGWQIMSPLCGDDTNRFMSELFEAAGAPGPATAVQTFMIRQSVLRAWGRFQEHHPLILAPVFTAVPWERGRDLTTTGVAEILRGMRMAVAVNALGLPAVTLPVGTGGGLPRSVQVIGPRYREDLCLDAAGALEDRTGIITPIDPR